MRHRLVTCLAPCALVAALALSGCGTHSAKTSSAAPSAAASTASGATTRLAAFQSDKLGAIVTDQSGFTLYRFEKDTLDPPTSNCSGQCAITWPPAIATANNVSLNGIDNSLVSTITRGDGTKQFTIAGHPVYRYIQDKAPGDTNGQGVGSTWFAVTPTGQKASSPGGGALNVAQSDKLGTIVVDADGFTLYRFNKDTASPPTSNCNGSCATTWPPAVITSTTITANGIDRSLIGTIVRADGTRQLTIAGWPVYEYSGDTAAGETNGQGVGGTWFAVTPTGQRNTAAPAAAPSGPVSASPSQGY
jgi:predicted lipoprotein with Yx(FWY)xxD motif